MESKMKYFIVFIALFGQLAWPQLQTGSVIFIDFEKDGITMSADSRRTSARDGRHSDNECKISAFGDKFAFQIAGLIRNDIPNGWDVRLIARRIWQSESRHETDAAKLVQAVSDKWIVATRKIYSDPEYLRYKRRSHPERPAIANAVFAATDSSGKLALRAINVAFDVTAFDSTGAVRLDYPAKKVSAGEWISAGSNQIIMEFMLRSSPRAKEFMSQWKVESAKLNPIAQQAALASKMIELSISLHPHPEEIGLPVDVLQIIPRTGIHWVQRKTDCAAK
jgi:hypothetical protein